jgi:hypothetical protein
MQNLQDLQDKILFETKNILNSLSQIDTKEELLSKQDLFIEITDRIAFLRILENNKDFFIVEENAIINNNSFNFNRTEDISLNHEEIEEEVQFTNEINNIEEKETTEEISVISESLVEDNPPTNDYEKTSEINSFLNDSEIEEREIPLVVEQEEPNFQERVLQKEKEFLESEERRRTIVEFNQEDLPQSIVKEPFEDENQYNSLTERKFKLANIKGLKAVQNLFDEGPLEDVQKENFQMNVKPHDVGSILKTNISTNFIEVEKKKSEFKLDFNDKVAFTKILFKGNEEELKLKIDKLNSFDNLEDAKQYLSEIYYDKDWQKVDEYAQRLWNLVENKFL